MHFSFAFLLKSLMPSSLFSRYGKVFKSHLFGHRTIVSCDHELNMLILQNEEKLFQSSYPQALHGILGELSLILVTGDVHKKLKSLALGMIGGTKSTVNFLPCIERLSISMMESWKELKEVVFCKEAKRASNSQLSLQPQ